VVTYLCIKLPVYSQNLGEVTKKVQILADPGLFVQKRAYLFIKFLSQNLAELATNVQIVDAPGYWMKNGHI
jgi:hypothetical protein